MKTHAHRTLYSIVRENVFTYIHNIHRRRKKVESSEPSESKKTEITKDELESKV